MPATGHGHRAVPACRSARRVCRPGRRQLHGVRAGAEHSRFEGRRGPSDRRSGRSRFRNHATRGSGHRPATPGTNVGPPREHRHRHARHRCDSAQPGGPHRGGGTAGRRASRIGAGNSRGHRARHRATPTGRSVGPARQVVSVTVDPVPLLIVPDVVGMTVQRARRTVERAGLRLDAPNLDGTVIGQQPPAGSSAVPGTTVLVTIAVPRSADRRLLVGAGSAALLAVAASAIPWHRWRRRQWVAHHVRVTPTRDPGNTLRHGGATTRSWRVTVQGNPGPTIPAQARKVTHADTSG